MIERADALLSARRTEDARDLLIPWLKEHPKAPGRDHALLLMAGVYMNLGERVKSFYQLDELLDNYPDSPYYALALARQYGIGEGFLDGYKLKFAGLRIIPAEDEAIEMLYRIQERSPGSALAERALLRTADYYYRNSEYDLASDAYAAFVRIYPRSLQIAQVKLRRAFSSLAQFRGVRFDATPLIDARSQLQQIIAEYPGLASDENLPDIIDRINKTFAAKVDWTADFYRRTHHPRAAVYNYRYLVENYPNSREAESARRQLQLMPASAKQEAAPPESRPGENPPTTQPGDRSPASPVAP